MSFIEIEYREREDSWGMSDLQSHDYYELYFLTEGERQFFFGEKVFNISAPAVCIIPPFAMHKTSGGRYKRVNINVSADMLYGAEANMLAEMSEVGVFSLNVPGSDIIISLLKAGAETSVIEVGERQRLCLSFVHTILHLLGKANPEPLDRSAKQRRDEGDGLILKVVSYLNDNYKYEISLDDISERFYISKNALCARFKEEMSCSVMQYLSFVRLNHAKELLATTDKSMEEISELCGYSSANYFSLIFKKSVGMSPKNYKKTK